MDRKSQDETHEIARRNADIFFEFDWNDNFSEIRNQLIKKSNGKWILISDGHEIWYHVDRIPEILLKLPKDCSAIAFMLEMSQSEGGTVGQQIRLFKNNPKTIYYAGAVHNRLTIDDSNSFATDLVKIYHDRPIGRRKERHPQRKSMIAEKFEQELKENPNSPRANFYLGAFYLSESVVKDEFGTLVKDGEADKETLEKAIPFLEKYISLSEFYEEIYLAKWYLGQAYYHLGKVEKMKEIALDMFEQMHELPLAQGMLGEMYLQKYKNNTQMKRNLSLAEIWFKLAINKKVPFVSCFFPKAYFTYLPWEKLTEVYSISNSLSDVIFCAQKTLQYKDFNGARRDKLINYLKQWQEMYNSAVKDENIGSSGTRNRKSDNVHTVNIGNG